VSADELKAKFRDLTVTLLGEKTDLVINEILSLEQTEKVGFLESINDK
jgi:hypothetical protein